MDWQDEGVILSLRRHGESAAIVELFTASHGRHAGVVRGGGSRRNAPLLMPGAQVAVGWRARLEDHIGVFTVEPVHSRAAILSDRTGLAGLNALCAMLHYTLPEREPHRALYARSVALMDRIGEGPGWAADYLRWEALLLEDLGYGLDLGRCAVTGAVDDLAFVSPRSGRAVSRAGAGEWADRLLPLPPVLLGQGPAAPAEVLAGLKTTGHFLARLMEETAHRRLPEARGRLIEVLAKAGGPQEDPS